ncbi:MAG: hypothetical protein K0R54_114 [Clostridiaceae bacterium]|jgi:hypothetical protein|nr:hypothetical protein [Clostridiaceae bacterium]
MESLSVGDYILYEYITKEFYPGKIVAISKNNKVTIEICMNKRKSEGMDTEVLEANINKIIPRNTIY